MPLRVLVRATSAVLPGEGSIQSVLRGETSISRVDHPAVRVGSAWASSPVEDARIPSGISSQLSTASRMAVVAGLDALERAGCISADTAWQLPEAARDRTGVLFATSFDHHELMLRTVRAHAQREERARLRATLRGAAVDEETLRSAFGEAAHEDEEETMGVRKVALQLLLGANVQLAQLVKARGFNTCTSNACASVCAALVMAQHALWAGEADRMVVLASDALLRPDTLEVVRSFVHLRAASTAPSPEEAVRPFSTGRCGFVLGEGAVALVLEREEEDDLPSSSVVSVPQVAACRLANSAYHGTRLDACHLAAVLGSVVDDCCARFGLADRAAFARCAAYVAHETFTPLCFDVEAEALRTVFGEEAVRGIPLMATKACTGHMMGAGVEDLVAIECLRTRRLPRMVVPHVEERFADLRFADGEAWEEGRFVLHASAGLGSHVAVVVYAR